MRKKTFKVTSKIAYAFRKRAAADALVDKYIENDNHDRAVEMQEREKDLQYKAWELVFDLYPKLKGKELVYREYCKDVIIKENG